MHITSRTSDDGVTRQQFTLDDGATGALWHVGAGPARQPRPIVLVGHGGGQHHEHPAVTGRARRCVEAGFVVAALDAPGHGQRPRSASDDAFVDALRSAVARGESIAALVADHNADLAGRGVGEWRSLLDALTISGWRGDASPVGFWGLSLGGATGLALAAGEPRLSAAVVGLAAGPRLTALARGIRAPLLYLMQWDDEHAARDDALALFDALGCSDRTLHANPGRHADVPDFERDAAVEFLRRHLTVEPPTDTIESATPETD